MSEELCKRIDQLEAKSAEDLKQYMDVVARNDMLQGQLAEHEWVSVEDRLPEEDLFRRVLILSENRLSIATYYEHGTLGFVFNSRGGFFDTKGNPLGSLKDYSIKPFTHWKTIHLPQPKKSEQKGTK